MYEQNPALSTQEKLALMMTGAGSQRKLAAALGISHQKLGRWLREGEEGGVKKIKLDDDTKAALDFTWKIHKEVSRQQAKRDNVPFDERIPVYMTRFTKSDGSPSDIVRAETTQYIRQDVRKAFFASQHKSGRYVAASLRSTVNIRSYKGSRAQDPHTRPNASFRQSANNIIHSGGQNIPLFTQLQNFTARATTSTAIKGIEALARQRHEPHAVDFADVYSFQLRAEPRKTHETAEKKLTSKQRRIKQIRK